ncbi:MAG: FAD-binding oxidoreductase [Patescibacteria group bacterium]
MKEDIQKIFKGDVEDSDETLTKYSHDASVFEIRPKVVLFPKDTEDIQNLVKWVNENKDTYGELSITARCAGTDMSGGAVGESIILDFTRYMNQVLSFEDPLKIVVQPGMFYRDFEKVTLEKGTILPCYTASKNLNAVGGMFGNNSAGERTLKYGKTEEYVVEAKVVFNDGNAYTVKPLNEEELKQKMSQGDYEGNLYKSIFELIQSNKEEIQKAKPNVHKNSAGYTIWNVWSEEKKIFDLNKLLVGSQGTLGIATEITFKLVVDPKYTKLLVVFLRDMSLVPELVNRILKYNPQTLESYDDKTFFLVLKYIKDFTKLLGVKNLFKLIFSFGPETMMTLRHGFPKLILLVEFTGHSQEEADIEAERALADLKSMKGIGIRLTRDAFEAKKYWTIRHEAFNMIRYHLKKVKSKPFIDDVIVRPEKLPEFFPALYKILGDYKKRMTFAVGGHAGDGNLHIYTLVNPKDKKLREMIMEVSDRVYDLVVRLGGSITAEHNDGLIRTAYLTKMYNNQIINIFKQIKEIFDPKYILNPGKKVVREGREGTKEYMASHITLEK